MSQPAGTVKLAVPLQRAVGEVDRVPTAVAKASGEIHMQRGFGDPDMVGQIIGLPVGVAEVTVPVRMSSAESGRSAAAACRARLRRRHGNTCGTRPAAAR